MLGTEADLSGFSRLLDERLAGLAELALSQGFKPPRFPTVFEALVNGVVFQGSLAMPSPPQPAGGCLRSRLGKREPCLSLPMSRFDPPGSGVSVSASARPGTPQSVPACGFEGSP